MGRFAEDSVYSNAPSPTTGAGLAILASNQRAILELPGAQAPQLVTIADGAITPTGAFLRVDTEGQAAADDLTIINVTINDTESLHDGMIVYLQAADSGRVVTIKNTASAGGITTYDGQDTTLSTDSWLQLQLQGGNWVEMYNQRTGAAVPVGSIIWSANATVPAGYLLCNGASVGRDTYPELFAAIGTTYGEGDGSTTFNLPNLIGRFIETALPCIKAFSAVIGDATVVAGQLVNEIQSKVALDGSNVSSIGSTLSTYMAHAAMPSGQYIILTVPANSGTVTAPADGWICFRGVANTNGICYIGLETLAKKIHTTALVSYTGYGLGVYLPCSSGDVIKIIYGYVSGTELSFVYANGSAPTV